MLKTSIGRAGLAVAAAAGVAGMARSVRARLRAQEAVLPELRHPLLLLPLHLNSRALVQLVRRAPVPPAPLAPGVEVVQHTVPGRGEHPSVGVYLYDTGHRRRPSGALLWIHGGGFVIGDPVTYHELCSRFARELDVAVVSVDYRLAPDHPFPAGLEDCYTALSWLHDHATELGVDPARIAIAGDSAGGGLSAALAQLACDRGQVPVRFQLLVYPMLDDRTVLRADHAGTGTFIWSPSSNRFGWTSYLGHEPRPAQDRPYAAAARREDLTGLPPAWIGVGTLDLFHAEDVAYAERLQASGVACELEVVPGMYHGADALFASRAPAMKAFRDSMIRALGAALNSERADTAGPR